MRIYKEESADHSGSMSELFDAVDPHVYPTLRAVPFWVSASENPKDRSPATLIGIFLAETTQNGYREMDEL